MIELLPSPGPDVAAFRAGGKITSDDIEKAWRSIDAALDEASEIGMYIEIIDLGGFTLDALIKDIAIGFKQIGHLKRFPRIAVVTDQTWVGTVAEIEGKLLPGVEIRTFPTVEDEAAMAWLTTYAKPLGS